MKQQASFNKKNTNSSKSKQKSNNRSDKRSPQPRSVFAAVAVSNVNLLLWSLVIAVITFVVYLPALKNGITNFDDNLYITDNPYLNSLSAANIKAMFSSYYMGNYHPLSMISLAMDFRWSSEEGYYMYHLTNLILHVLNTVLVFVFSFFVFRVATVAKPANKVYYWWVPAVAALLFGVHTIHLESVAWVSERKDVLYTFFFLLSAVVYIKYLNSNSILTYVLSVVLFLLSLLSKGQAVSLAVTLLAIDYLAGRKLTDKKLMLEKIPFFVLALIFGYVAILAQKSSESIALNDAWSFHHRILFASYGFLQYIIKLIAPLNLSVFYPYPKGSIPAEYIGALVGVLGIVAAAVYAIRKDARIVVFAMLFFAVNIFLVLQLLPVGKAIMADRYAYIPSVGFFILLAYGLYRLAEWLPKLKIGVLVLVVAYALSISYLSYNRCELWGSSLSLWNNVLEQFPNSELAYNNRGDILSNENPPRYKEALVDFNRAIELDPNYDQTYYNRGVVRAHLGDKPGAIDDFNKAIQLKPEYAQAYSNRGATRFEMGDKKAAIEDFTKAIQYKPDYAMAYSNRGSAKAMLGDTKGAMEDFDKALQIDPNNAKLLYFRGLTRYDNGRKQEGCMDLQAAASLGYAAAQQELAKRCK